MKRHPYKPGKSVVIRVHKTQDSFPVREGSGPPCQWRAGGKVCGLPERRMIHHPPFPQKIEVKTKPAPETKGVGDDAPVL